MTSTITLSHSITKQFSQVGLGAHFIFEWRYFFCWNTERLILLAMVSDTTGINPAYYERRYGESKVFQAMSNCSEAISIITSENELVKSKYHLSS